MSGEGACNYRVRPSAIQIQMDLKTLTAFDADHVICVGGACIAHAQCRRHLHISVELYTLDRKE